MTRIVKSRPPNYSAIVAALGPPRPSTVYAYDNTIYAPIGKTLSLDLIRHEETHFRQQAAAGGAEPWWDRYLADPHFRLRQELEAYRAQLAAITDRATRRQVFRRVSADLASSMYGRIISVAEARRRLESPA